MTVNDRAGVSYNVYDPDLTVEEMRALARSLIARLPDEAVKTLLDEVLRSRSENHPIFSHS